VDKTISDEKSIGNFDNFQVEDMKTPDRSKPKSFIENLDPVASFEPRSLTGVKPSTQRRA